MSQTSNVLKVIRNPIVSFFLGFLMCYILLKFIILFVATILIIAVAIYLFRDKIDFKELLGRLKEEALPDKNRCEECGSKTKHLKTCSHYGETVKKKEVPIEVPIK